MEGGRTGDVDSGWQWQVRERAGVYMQSLPSRVSGTVPSSLEHMQAQTQPRTCYPAAGSPWLWAKTEARHEQSFTFWIGPPRRTTVVYDAPGGHVGSVSMLLPQTSREPEIMGTYAVCASACLIAYCGLYYHHCG